VRRERRVDDLDELELGLLSFLEQRRPTPEEHRDEVDADLVDEAGREYWRKVSAPPITATPLSPAAASACSNASSMPLVANV